MQLIDTHCHLDFPNFNADRRLVIERAIQNNVSTIINVGASLSTSQKGVSLSKQYDCIYATVGVHPHEAAKLGEDDWKLLEELAIDVKVVAIGEVGLDYYRNLSPAAKQREVFERSIALSKKLGLPLIVHCRQATREALSILKMSNLNRGVVVHCFSHDRNFLKSCLDLGFFVSFTGNITYKKSDCLRELVTFTPLDRFFLETDAPFLSPQAVRGKRNEPAYLAHILAEVASILHLDKEIIAAKTTENARRFFNLK